MNDLNRNQDVGMNTERTANPVEPRPMPGMALHALGGEIVAALKADSQAGAYDVAAGQFGPAFTTLVRRWALAEWRILSTGEVQPQGVHTISGKTAEELWMETGHLRAQMADMKVDNARLRKALTGLKQVAAPFLTQKRQFLAPTADGEATGLFEETITADELDAACRALGQGVEGATKKEAS